MQILDRRTEFSTPWFRVVAKRTPNNSTPYYALDMQDYVTVAALTARHELLLVRQYRPAVERYTLELPSGHVEDHESPEAAARRELAEECGFEAGRLELLSALLSDTGRHENRLWCFYAPNATPLSVACPLEPGVERVVMPGTELSRLISTGQFDHALDLAVLMLVVVKHGLEVFALK
jgi:ADP-ribose pyrophosphatase